MIATDETVHALLVQRDVNNTLARVGRLTTRDCAAYREHLNRANEEDRHAAGQKRSKTA